MVSASRRHDRRSLVRPEYTPDGGMGNRSGDGDGRPPVRATGRGRAGEAQASVNSTTVAFGSIWTPGPKVVATVALEM